MVAALGAVLLVVGLSIATIGLYGLLRRRDIFEQLHAAGLVTGPGVILVLLASVATARTEIITSAILVVAFVLVTASLSTHAIALAAWRRRQVRAAARTSAARDAAAAAGGQDAGDGSTRAMRVLLAHDGSPESELAVRLTASLALPHGSGVRLVRVTEGDLPALADIGRRPSPEPRDEGGSALDDALRALARPGVVVDAVARSGRPATAIVAEAAAFEAQLVVIGRRGLGRIRSLLMGSVAREVVDRAPCPVLVARSASIREVLLASDGSRTSSEAIEAVARWAIFGDARIHVLAVGADNARDAAADVAAQLSGLGRDVLAHHRGGDPAGVILAFADAAAIDVIVLGSRGLTGLGRALLGSVATEVLDSAKASVLIVPAAERGAGR